MEFEKNHTNGGMLEKYTKCLKMSLLAYVTNEGYQLYVYGRAREILESHSV